MSSALTYAALKASKGVAKWFLSDPIGATSTIITIANYVAIPVAVASAGYGIYKFYK